MKQPHFRRTSHCQIIRIDCAYFWSARVPVCLESQVHGEMLLCLSFIWSRYQSSWHLVYSLQCMKDSTVNFSRPNASWCILWLSMFWQIARCGICLTVKNNTRRLEVEELNLFSTHAAAVSTKRSLIKHSSSFGFCECLCECFLSGSWQKLTFRQQGVSLFWKIISFANDKVLQKKMHPCRSS